MQTLEVSKQGALAAHKQADPAGRLLLETLFGKEIFQTDVRDRIRTMDSAYWAVGLSDLDARFNDGTPDDIAYQQLKLAIIPALNEGWVADYNDPNQEKWWPIFCLDKRGGSFRFHAACFDLVRTHVTGGPRLAFRTRELAIHAAECFPDVFRNFYM